MNLSKVRQGILSAFPVPRYLSLGTLACVVDHETVRYIEFSRSGRGRHIKRYGSKKIKEEVKDFKSSLIQIKDEIAEAILPLGVRSVSLVIPERFAYVFLTEIPFTEKSLIKEAINFQLEEHIPITAAEALFEYDIVSSDKEKNTMTIAVRAVPKQEVELRVELFSSLGILVSGLDTTGKAIAKAVSYGDGVTRMIIHVNRASTSFIISKDGSVLFSSTLMTGAVDMDKALAKAFSISDAEVEKMKISLHGAIRRRTRGLSTPSCLFFLRSETR